MSRFRTKLEDVEIIRKFEKFNPNHDELGQFATSDSSGDYQMSHRPAMGGQGDAEGAPLHDLTSNGTYPSNAYASDGARMYSTGYKEMDKKVHDLITRVKGNPDAIVKIYRAVPKGVTQTKIGSGDWVTPIKDYAVQHGESNLNGEFNILTADVRAGDIYTSGDSWLEWGYNPTSVQKHGTHDQKTHGSWATLTGDELLAEWESPQGRIPTSPANPEGTNTQALRSWVDGPFRNFSANYPIQDVIRHIQHGVLGLPLTPYYEVYSDRQRYIDERTINAQTRNLIESLDSAPSTQPVLWRGQGDGNQRTGILEHGGMGYDSLLRLKEGDEFVAPMFSTSRDKGIAGMYAEMGIGKNSSTPAVIFRIAAGAKGLRTTTVPMDKEVLTGGKFRVTGTAKSTMKTIIDYDSEKKPIFKDHPLNIVSLTQIDTFGKEDYVKENFTPDSQFRVGRNR